MGIATTQAIFPALESGDPDAIRRLLEEDPGLVHVRHADPDVHHWTPLQFAAAKGQLYSATRVVTERRCSGCPSALDRRQLFCLRKMEMQRI